MDPFWDDGPVLCPSCDCQCSSACTFLLRKTMTLVFLPFYTSFTMVSILVQRHRSLPKYKLGVWTLREIYPDFLNTELTRINPLVAGKSCWGLVVDGFSSRWRQRKDNDWAPSWRIGYSTDNSQTFFQVSHFFGLPGLTH